MHADILPDFDLAIQPRFTAENVNKSLPPFLYSSLLLLIQILANTNKLFLSTRGYVFEQKNKFQEIFDRKLAEKSP